MAGLAWGAAWTGAVTGAAARAASIRAGERAGALTVVARGIITACATLTVLRSVVVAVTVDVGDLTGAAMGVDAGAFIVDIGGAETGAVCPDGVVEWGMDVARTTPPTTMSAATGAITRRGDVFLRALMRP